MFEKLYFTTKNNQMNKFVSLSIETLGNTDDISALINVIKKSPDTIVFTRVWECHPLEGKWKKNFLSLISCAKLYNKKVILIINSWYESNYMGLQQTGVDEIVFLDYFLLLVYLRLSRNKESAIVQKWNSNSSTWLFLTGKPNKLNRLGFLYYLYQNNLLDKCVWSLFVNKDLATECKYFLYELDDLQSETWLNRFSQSPDDIKIAFTKSGYHYSGIPFGNIYESALFQVVSESAFVNIHPWITEKTWLSIINRRPMMIFGNPGSMPMLEKMGFETYNNFLIDTEFDQSDNVQDRYVSLGKNIQHWIKNLSKHADEISHITEHNHQQLIAIAESNIEKLKNLSERYNLNAEFDQLVVFRDEIQHAQWHNWYNRIKDPSWPDCPYEEMFCKLPQRIQKECIEIFGYNPERN